MATKRERINEDQYARRDEKGRFEEVESVKRAAQQDQKRQAKNTTKSGQGDKGDRRS